MRFVGTGFCLVCLACLAWIGASTWHGRAAKASKPASAESLPPVPVRVATVGQTPFTTYQTAIGTIQAYNMVTVRARVDGQLDRVTFEEGQDVKAGDVLAVIDQRPLRAALEQAEAVKAKDQAQLQNNQRDLQRYLDLKSYASRQSTETQQALVSQMQATLLGDQAAVDNATVQLSFATIRAPIGGRTGARLVDAGNMIRASEGASLLSITQIEPITGTFTLPQDLLDRVRVARLAGPVTVQALSGDDTVTLASGTLSLIDNQIDAATGTIRMKATFANKDHRLWPGEFVNIHVVTDVDPEAVTVQQQVVQNGPGGRFVYVVKPDMSVEARPVVEGASRDGVIMIKAGLKPGERVVLDGQSKLRSDSRVVISGAAEAANTASR